MLPPMPEEPVAAPLLEPPDEPPPPVPDSPRKIAWARRGRSFRHSWKIYRGNWMGKVGLVILIGFIGMALAAPLFVDPEDLSITAAADKGIPAAPIKPTMLITDDYIQAYIEQNTTPGTPTAEAWEAKLQELKGTWTFPLGTDHNGRDMLKLMIWGSRISLIVGLVATFMTMTLGAGIGIACGFFGGRVDRILERITDWFLVIPWVPFAIVLATILGESLFNVILVIAITSWAVTARLVRSQALSVVTRPYVERGRALGASNWHIMSRHMLPNLTPIILANTVLTVSLTILSEAYLSFLGLGDPTSVSWGSLLSSAQGVGAMTGGFWWYVFPPGIAITFVVLAFTLAGVAIEEVTNPKLRKR